jgi:polar amino acid transport system substrate-binding protein
MKVFRRLVLQAAIGIASLGSLAAHASPADDPNVWKQVKEAGALRCGSAISAPWVMRDPITNTYSGLFPALCKEFGEKVLKVKVEFVDTGWDNIVAGLQSGKWDLSQSLNQTPERAKAISFSAAVSTDAVTFVYNKNNPKFAGGIKTVADLDNPNINLGVVSGTSNERLVSNLFKKAKITKLPGASEVNLALMSKRVDMVVDNKSSNLLVSEAHKDWSATFEPSPGLSDQAVTFGVRKDIPPQDLAVLDEFIVAKVKSGEMDKLMEQSVQEMLSKQ